MSKNEERAMTEEEQMDGETRTDGDVAELARLKALDDPRTIPQMKAGDDNFTEGVLTAVERGETGFTLVYDGWTLGLSDSDNPAKIIPAVGDKIRVYGQFGQPVYGIDIAGRECFWYMPLERFARRVAVLAGFDRERRERFVKAESILDGKYEALSAPMKARIDRFRSERADFRVAAEAYEMVACVDGDLIAGHLRPRVEAGESPETVVKEFQALPWGEQRKIGVDEGHSGNTFGGACRLALALLAGESV